MYCSRNAPNLWAMCCYFPRIEKNRIGIDYRGSFKVRSYGGELMLRAKRMNRVTYIRQQIMAGINNDTLLANVHTYAATVETIRMAST